MQIWLLLGGNIGDTQEFFKTSTELIRERIGDIIKKSSVYKSEAWGFEANQDFLNQVILIETEMSANKVLNETQKIERELGRNKKTTDKNYSSRVIDIDILFLDNKIIDLPHLSIPHPRIAQRRFTLLPLAEVSGDYIHPTLNFSVNKLLEICTDESIVVKTIK